MAKILERLIAAREDNISLVRSLIEKATDEDRDLTEAENSLLETAQAEIERDTPQIDRLTEYETLTQRHLDADPTRHDSGGQGEKGETALTMQSRKVDYDTPAEFLADYSRALTYTGPAARAHSADAAQRVSAYLGRAVNDVPAGAHQTTEDTPGLLPKPVVGQVLNMIDANRPVIESLGPRDMSMVPGKTFSRPVVTSHTVADEQTAEKGELIAGEVKIDGIDFTKRTFGTYMNVSLQEIDFTSPAVWDILLADMAAAYADRTERYVASEFATAVTATQAVASDDVQGWVQALYAARSAILAGKTMGLLLPTHIWVSPDMDASIGALVELHFAMNTNAVGSQALASIGGTILGLPRVVSAHLPEGTVIVGRNNLAEFYEHRRGWLQAVEPKHFGIEVAYGGYAAFGVLDPSAFVKVTAPAGG